MTAEQSSFLILVAKHLTAYRKAKAEERKAKALLIQMTCEIGIPQEDALKMSVVDFLDGYLVANNHVQKHRKAASDGVSQ